jgi:hypothetical protein
MRDSVRLQLDKPSNMTLSAEKLAEEVLDLIIHLPGGVSTPIHIVKYRKSKVRPRLAIFEIQKGLLAWCRENNISDAINGGFTLYHTETLLGEHRLQGQTYPHQSFTAPWDTIRGTLHVASDGKLSLAPRHHFPDNPEGDLLQAAPLLVHNGKSLIEPGIDPEGIAASSDQLDDDWTVERFPRAAIGTNKEFIWCIATDGYDRPERTSQNVGLSLIELAEIFVKIGATEALNLDGGSSATLVSESRLVNHPRAGHRDKYSYFHLGRPIPSAIVFEPL